MNELKMKSSSRINRETFFFGPANREMYAMSHLPEYKTDTAVIFCQAFADEVQRSYRPLYNFADILAANGYIGFRFDYRGCGDSRMDHIETDVSSRLEDINTAVDYVKSEYSAEKVILLGLRFGATMAWLASDKYGRIDGLILWEPILDGRKYFYDCLRLNIATQMAVYRKVLYNREKLVSMLDEGEPLYIEGYPVGKKLFDEGCAINLSDSAGDRNVRCLALNINQNPSANSSAKYGEHPLRIIAEKGSNWTYAVAQGQAFWIDKRNYIPAQQELYDITMEWLKGGGKWKNR